MTKILVISHSNDAHVKILQNHIDEEMIIFDPLLFPFNNDITYSWNTNKFEIYSKERHFNNVDAVWYRKPIYLQLKDFPTPPEYREFAQKSYEAAIKTIYDLLRDKLWVSDWRNIMRAGNKLLQLELAAELGFKIPETIVSSNPLDVQLFRDQIGDIITKSLIFQPVTKKDGERYVFYTSRIPKNSNVDFSGLAISPAMFQREIPKYADIRITVVGENVFPCRILSTGNLKHEIDWRVGITGNEVHYEICHDFPKPLQKKCVELVKLLGLQFGAIDFIQDYENVYWFLEINPNGQWGFIEENTNLQIAESLAKLFYNQVKQR